MVLDDIEAHLEAYKSTGEITDAAKFLVHSFGLEHFNLVGFGLRTDEKPNFIVLTTEGELGGPQKIMIPRNLFDFDISLVLNLLAHEMLHVRQKTLGQVVEDKNEREFLAYYEMLFHTNFPQIPDAPDFNRKQFAEKALEYYKRMGENSDLQRKYAEMRDQVQRIFENLNQENPA